MPEVSDLIVEVVVRHFHVGRLAPKIDAVGAVQEGRVFEGDVPRPRLDIEQRLGMGERQVLQRHILQCAGKDDVCPNGFRNADGHAVVIGIEVGGHGRNRTVMYVNLIVWVRRGLVSLPVTAT